MGVCESDIFCEFLSQFITISSPFQYGLIKLALGITAVLAIFQFGRIYGKVEANRKSTFIDGIMYHINVMAYNDAKMPQKHDVEKDEHLTEAYKRIEKKLKPKVPK